MKTLRKVTKGLGLFLLGLFLWMATPADYFVTVWPFVSSHPESITRYSDNHKTAFVFFTGTQSSGTALSAPLRSLWQEHADVVVVEYNRIRFDGPQTAYDTYLQLRKWGYTQVILDGASLGGLLATDVIDYDRVSGNHMKFAVMMQDVPMDADDLVQSDGAKAISGAWWPGWVTNLLLTSKFWSFNFNPPPRDQLGAGVDDQQLAAQYEASRTYPLSGWVGEIRYIVTHAGFVHRQYFDVPLVYMQSEHDGVVKPTADRWKDAFDSTVVITVPHAGHADFVEHPQEWRDAFRAGFEALPAGW